MASTHSTLGEFVSWKKDWKSYTECLLQYFAANDIDNAGKQRAILINSCGATTYRLIKDVIAPRAPTEVSFNEIVQKMTAHCQPPPSEIMQRYRFNTRVRHSHETVSTYLAQLKQLAEYCNYGDSLPMMLQDRLVCGIAQQQWQKRLLVEDDLTYNKAVKLLLSMESADQDILNLSSGSKQVNRLSRGKPNPPKQAQQSRGVPTCYRCGNKHKATDCPFKEAEYHFCHKKGHLAAVCRTKQKRQERKKSQPGTPPSSGTHQVTETVLDTETPEQYDLYYICPKDKSAFTVYVNLNQIPLCMEVDTEAALSLISKTTYHSLWPDKAPPLKKSNIKLKSYTNTEIDVEGVIDVEVEYQKQRANLQLLIVAGSGPSLLGRNWLQRNGIKLDWSPLNHIVSTNSHSDIQAIMAQHDNLFQAGLGKITIATAKIYIDANVKPCFSRA